MAIVIPGRVVVFDYGEVISVSPSESHRRVLERIAGVPAGVFWAAYQADRDELDGGELSTHDYWAGIGRACGQDWDAARIQALWCADIHAWVSADPDVVTLIEELHAGGTRLACCRTRPRTTAGCSGSHRSLGASIRSSCRASCGC